MNSKVISFNIPYLLDFFYSSNDGSSARTGRVIDAEMVSGGLKLWNGHRHLIIELHSLRALYALLKKYFSGS